MTNPDKLAADPYGDTKIYHMASKFSSLRHMRPLCSPKRALDMKYNVWTIREEVVTCPKCLKLLTKQD